MIAGQLFGTAVCAVLLFAEMNYCHPRTEIPKQEGIYPFRLQYSQKRALIFCSGFVTPRRVVTKRQIS